MAGVIVLEGGGPFTANDDLDRRVLAGRRTVVLPTADAFETPGDLVAEAQAWGERLGIEVEPLMVLTRPDANDEAAAIIGAADAVVLVGDSANHLRSALLGTPVFAAIQALRSRDGVVLAVGASASALCDPMADRRGGAFALGLGLVPGMTVITETESWSPELLQRAHELADVPHVDLPTGAAIVRSDDGWETVGAATVHGDLPV
jgi:cyanophycinase